jgi:two-component system OmpR family response regulator
MGRVAKSRDPEPGRYKFAGWQLERCGRKLGDPWGAPPSLSKGEYALLLTREHLLQATRVHEDNLCRSIDVQVLRLRCTEERLPRAPRAIQTERDVGYMFAQPVEPY